MDLVVFWVAAPVAVASGVLMLLQRNAVHSALYLILNQFMLAVLFVVLGAPFLAAVQVIVYAGAIMVLFLFVIMFLGVDRREALVETIRGQRVAAIGLGLLVIAEIVVAVRLGVGLGRTAVAEVGAAFGSAQSVGQRLFTHYVFPFEVTSVLLIVAAIAAMVLAQRRPAGEESPEAPAQATAPPEREPVP